MRKSRGILFELRSLWKQFRTSWDFDGMIMQEEEEIEHVLENFALPQQAVRNFAQQHYLTPSLLNFALLPISSAKLVDITK